MTPGARISAAITVLDQILAGGAAERALTNWARGARYAGAKDRAAVRDHVFDALRCKRSYAWIGGAETGRALMLGALWARNQDPGAVFNGEGHAPFAQTASEQSPRPLKDAPDPIRLDMPDWIWPQLQRAYPEHAEVIAQELQHRAPVFVRVNRAKGGRAGAIAQLQAAGITARPHPLSETALELVENPRRLAQSEVYRTGLVELQDAASQAVVDFLPPAPRVLDYCAGGGGKSLAIAASGSAVFAHDANAQRMRDLPERARRAGCQITCLSGAQIGAHAPFDLVLCDVPCSGSGAWRRSPEGKWRLTPKDLERLVKTQEDILRDACDLVAPGGHLAYVTCSLLPVENDAVTTAFCRANSAWQVTRSRQFTPLDGGDGFYVALLRRQN